MKIETIIQNPLKEDKVISDKIFSLVKKNKYDCFSTAVAYATIAGVRLITEIFENNNNIFTSQWVLGLDDYFTQPSAIDLIKTFQNSQLRITSSEYNGHKFHAKLYYFRNSNNLFLPALMLGSANLTRKAFTKNIELVTLYSSENKAESIKLESIWKQFWKLGENISNDELENYRIKFKENMERSQIPNDKEIGDKKEILMSDSSLVDPALANLCWIEVGKITGFQHEQLEIKAEQAIFFGLKKKGGQGSIINIVTSNGNSVSVPFKYRNNAMWRLNLPNEIPEVKNDLRPKGKRSLLVAVFTKKGMHGPVKLEFIARNSKRFKDIENKSNLLGTIGKTSSRLYGWY